jgi:hypothetical protein
MLAAMDRTPPRSTRRAGLRATRVVLALITAAALCTATAPAVLATAQASQLCGHFFKRGQDVIVSKRGPVSCGHAKTIIEDFWSSKGVIQHGTSDADSYWTIKAFPAWRCEQSMGEGSCTKHTATASYQVKA